MIRKWFPSKSQAHSTSQSTASEYIKATKLGIKVSEYQKRVKCVEAAYKACTWKAGDEGYPLEYAEFEKYGKMVVLYVVDHYDKYGDVQWADHPFILAVSPVDDPNTVVNCTINWLVEEEPTPEPVGKVKGTC